MFSSGDAGGLPQILCRLCSDAVSAQEPLGPSPANWLGLPMAGGDAENFWASVTFLHCPCHGWSWILTGAEFNSSRRRLGCDPCGSGPL